MLRGNDKTKLSRSDLIKKIEEQQLQINNYETKLKDLIRAYKGLSAERNALQTVVRALGSQQEATTSLEKPQNSVPHHGANAEEKELSEENQVESLKRSLEVLITEKNKLETAFRSDRKALLIENEALKKRLSKAAVETEAQAEKLENKLLELRSKIELIEGDREKELSDHGSVLAAIQQQYAKECVNSEQLEKQITELRRMLREKDEIIKTFETDIVSLKKKLSRAQNEASSWQKRAEKTPAIQVLESELQNVKESSENEIMELKRKLTETMNTQRDSRLCELEQRLQELSVEIGGFNTIRAELQHEVEQLEEKNKTLENQNAFLEASKSTKDIVDESTNFESLKQIFVKNAEQLRSSKQEINFYELLGLDETSFEQKQRYEVLKNEFEKYKLKSEAVLRNRSVKNDALKNSEVSHTLPLLPVSNCTSCAEAEGDLRNMRSLVTSLHDKLHSLETDYASAKNSYEEKTAQLQQKITEMEMIQENLISDLRNQMHQKVIEMESEMQKQRIRALDILAEKENELEITKAMLASTKSQSNVDPIDPPQGTSFQSVKYRKRRSNDLFESNTSIDQQRDAEIQNVVDHSSDADSCASVVDERYLAVSTRNSFTIPGTTAGTETRNIFYEQQLVKREKQIVELRNAIHVAELNVRDIQQAALIKDLQHFEMVEKLKDEIKILEGKLGFLSVDSNMEYLRNIFVQLLHCDSSSGRKHILKAIGAVLKLSVAEMRAIEKRSFL